MSAEPNSSRALPCSCLATMRKPRSRATVPGFRTALPGATVYVYDNNSRDRHARASRREAGAIVRTERQQGKGHVVRRMFADIDADVYVMADGDLTYDPIAAPAMVDLLLAEQLDMVVGTRRHEAKHGLSRRPRARQQAVHRPSLGPVRAQLHRHFLGLPGVFAALREELSGALVGVRDRDRDERPCARAQDAGRRGRDRYAARPEGSHSKLSTFGDGWRILKTIDTLYRIERPVLFYGSIGAFLLAAAILLAVPLVQTYLQTGLVPRFPTAILVTGMVIVAVLCFFAGLILDTVTRGRREVRRLAYLSLAAPGEL